MRHVDEGTIHAWLDGEITDPAEAAWIDEHLRWCAACSARVADERATLEQAHALLAVASPTAEPPAFHELAARAEKHTQSANERGAGSLQRSRWFLQVGWAASVVLAATIGWTARELADRDPVTSVALAPALEEVPKERRQGVPGDRAASAPSPSANTANTTTTTTPPPPPAPVAGSQSAVATGREAARSTDAIQQPLADRLREQRPVAAAQTGERGASFVSEPQLREAAARALAESSAGARRETSVGAAPGFPGRLSGIPSPLSVASAPAAAAPPPPAALGQSAAISVTQAPQAAVEARRGVPSPLQETVTVAGASPAADVATVTTSDWQRVPRTVAAVRSGMALYGIDGLEPVSTSISADGRIVRTVYRLESGVAVDLEQQRALPNGAAPVTSLQPTTARALPPAGRAGLTADVTPTRVWSEVRGGFRVLLRTTSDAADLTALGAKLRVD